jgi:hypothetical protein
MKTNLFCILSHCDSDEKKSALIDNINQIKNKGFDILLISHIPLSNDITSLVNYFIYDKSNPILHYPQKYIHFWKSIKINKETYQLSTYMSDYGWTALNQIKKAGAFCENLEYNNYTFINYDLQLTDKMFLNHNSNLVSQTKLTKTHPKEKGLLFSMIFFSFTSIDLVKLQKNLIKEEYAKGDYIAEDYFTSIINNNNIDYQLYPLEVEDKFDFKLIEDEYIWNLNKDNDYFCLFFDGVSIILYSLINPIKFRINNQDKLITENFLLKRSEVIDMAYHDYDGELIDILPTLDALSEMEKKFRKIEKH